jgi:hypothetical protein
MTEHETVELVQRAATGDELEWRRLVDQLGPLLGQNSSTYRLDEAEAADAVATAWFKLGEHVGSLWDACAVQGWLATTVRRSAWRESAYAVASGPWQTSELSAVLPGGAAAAGISRYGSSTIATCARSTFGAAVRSLGKLVDVLQASDGVMIAKDVVPAAVL